MVRGNVTVTFGYDGLGNLTSMLTEEVGEEPVSETYEYDYMNRLSVYTNSDTGASWSYQHWPNGDR